MSPVSTTHRVGNAALGDAIVNGNGRLSFAHGNTVLDYLNVCAREFCDWACISSWASAFLVTVRHVVLRCSEKQVRDFTARGHIAVVADKHALRNWPVVKLPNHSMHSSCSTGSDSNDAVAFRRLRTFPDPASSLIGRIKASMDAVNNRHQFRAALFSIWSASAHGCITGAAQRSGLDESIWMMDAFVSHVAIMPLRWSN